MSLQTINLPKAYRNGDTLFEENLDRWRLASETGFANANLNLTQLARDLFTSGYSYDNDGLSNKGTSLEDRINLLSAGGGVPISGTSADTFTINSDGNGATLSPATLTATRTFSFSDATGVLPSLPTAASTETGSGAVVRASGPTITAPIVTTGSYIDNGNSGATKTIDWATGNIQDLTLTANCTLTFSNLGNYERGLFFVRQDGTGSRTLIWPTNTRFLNAAGTTNSTTDAPVLTTTASKLDVFSVLYHSALNLIFVSTVGFTGALT